MKLEILSELVEKSLEKWPDNFPEYEKEFNQCCLSISYQLMKQLGLFSEKGAVETIESIKAKANLNPDAKYLLTNLLFILQEDGVLSKEENKYILNQVPDIPGPAELLISLCRKYPNEQAAFQWVARAYDGMLDFLQGKVYPEDVMFPWGSFELVEDVYNNSRIYSFYSEMTGLVMQKLLEKKYDNRKISILEVGAGTGNGTRHILKQTKNFSSYMFTDISKTLLRSSKKIFTDMFFDFKTLDIVKNPLEQDFTENQLMLS
ncbi:MAG: class I SAM-dependent methyltransferase [Spirochaetes bacterium]|nr:class I SAM-dependent methyltransferase [Spirochaetota bacterium]